MTFLHISTCLIDDLYYVKSDVGLELCLFSGNFGDFFLFEFNLEIVSIKKTFKNITKIPS